MDVMLMMACALISIGAPGMSESRLETGAPLGAEATESEPVAMRTPVVRSHAALRRVPRLRGGTSEDRSEGPSEIPDASDREPYGAVGTRYFEFGGFAGTDFENSDQPVLAASLTAGRFIADGLALGARLDLLAFDLEDDVSSAIAIGITFRWHFYRREQWTVFTEGGVGMMLSTKGVPDGGGSRFNFTPELGLGVTYDVGRPWRPVAGVRWHHVSNAKSWRSNPGRDGFVVYAGISVPF